MTPYMPPEIWRLIAQSLPDLQMFLTINSAFFQAAMDRRYRVVDLVDRPLNSMGMARTLLRLSHLRQAYVSRRVRYVIIEFTHFDLSASMVRYAFDANKRHWLTETHDPPAAASGSCNLNTYCDPFDELLQALTDAITSFHTATVYDLHWGSRCHPNSVPAFEQLWLSLGSNLRTLKWDSSPEGLQLFPRSNFTRFHALDEVFVTLDPLSHKVDTQEHSTTIASFLNHHCLTLRSLSFLMVSELCSRTLMDASLLLDALEYFPKLERLHLSFGIVSDTHIQTSAPAAITRFLNNHASTLKSFTVTLSAVSEPYIDDFPLEKLKQVLRTWFNVSLPSLVALHISIECVPGEDVPILKDIILSIIPNFSDTLITLSLNTFSPNGTFTYEQVSTIVSAFSHRSPDTGLKELVLAVDVLSPKLIDLLASSVPGLETLTLRALSLKPRSRSYKVPSHIDRNRLPRVFYQLRAEMQKRVYDQWALCHLAIHPLPSWKNLDLLAEIITERIPNIQKWR